MKKFLVLVCLFVFSFCLFGCTKPGSKEELKALIHQKIKEELCTTDYIEIKDEELELVENYKDEKVYDYSCIIVVTNIMQQKKVSKRFYIIRYYPYKNIYRVKRIY